MNSDVMEPHEGKWNAKEVVMPDAFDVVKDHLQAIHDGRFSRSRAGEIRNEILAVAARVERLRRISPAAAMACGLGEEFEALVSSVKGLGRGFLGMAAVL